VAASSACEADSESAIPAAKAGTQATHSNNTNSDKPLLIIYAPPCLFYIEFTKALYYSEQFDSTLLVNT
jgi:hypothetical protein